MNQDAEGRMSEMEAFIDRAMSKPDGERIEPTSSEQRSAAWLYARVGYITASRFNDVIAKTKAGKPTAAREKYLWEVVVERVTGQPQDHFSNSAMQWGEDTEPKSKMDHEAQTGELLESVGFIKHRTLPMVGCSPDALIGDDGGFESKSPYNSGIHLQTYLAGVIPEEHIAQVQGCMWITGRKWWWFKSYDPRLPEPLCRYVQRIERDDKYIAALETEIITFSAEVAAIVGRLAVFAERAAGGIPPSHPEPSLSAASASAPSETRPETLKRLCTEAGANMIDLLAKAEVTHADELSEADWASALRYLKKKAASVAKAAA